MAKKPKTRTATARIAGKGVKKAITNMWDYSRKRMEQNPNIKAALDDEFQLWAGIGALFMLETTAAEEEKLSGKEVPDTRGVRLVPSTLHERETQDAIVSGVVAFAEFCRKKGVKEVTGIDQTDDGVIVQVVEADGSFGAFCCGKGDEAVKRLASIASPEGPEQ